MRKIRGFKLTLRYKEIQRRAKKAKLDLAALGLGADPALSTWLEGVSAAARPAVLYDSFPAESAAPAGSNSMPGLAYSLCVATLGPDFDALSEKEVAASPERAPLWDVAAAAALDQAVGFVLKLVEEEAVAERCNLSPIQYITEPAALEGVLSRLEGHKIGVALSETGLRPLRSTAYSLSWLARSKSRAKT